MTARWPPASIRLRLTGWYVLALCLMLMAYAGATYLSVRHEFFEQLDEQLRDDFESAQASLSRTPDGRIVWSGDRRHDPDGEEGHGVDVWSVRGEEIYRASASSSLPPPAPARVSETPLYASTIARGARWRTLTQATSVDGVSVVLRASRSEERLHAQVWEILVVLILGLPVAVLVAGAGGYVLARRALAPMDRLASEAHRITAERLHERLSVPNPNDEVGRLAGVINDTLARLESSFDELRRFTADASHELRTPLAIIRGIGEVGLGEPRTPAEYKEAMGSMLEEVDRLTNLVDTLLRLSHGDAGTARLRKEATHLGRLASEVVSSLTILAEERGQRLRLETPEDVWVVADRLVLREAVANLIDNAVKYSRTSATIDIRVRAQDGQALLEVADEGPGIAPEHRQRIFDRFFRVDQGRSRAHGGTGLGLAIAKWAVEANGGRIIVEDGPSGGAVFRVTLPLNPVATRRHAEAREQMGGHP